MKVGSPAWQMRSLCPCCGQGGLTFSLLVFDNATSDQIVALGFTPDDYA